MKYAFGIERWFRDEKLEEKKTKNKRTKTNKSFFEIMIPSPAHLEGQVNPSSDERKVMSALFA